MTRWRNWDPKHCLARASPSPHGTRAPRRLTLTRLGLVPEKAERQIGPPLGQRLHRGTAPARQHRQRQARGHIAQAGDKRRDQHSLFGIERSQSHDARRGRRIEGPRRAEGATQGLDRRRHRRL